MRFIPFLALFIACAFQSQNSKQEKTIRGASGQNSIEIECEASEVSFERWGGSEHAATPIVTKIAIKQAGRGVGVPFSVYADLADPHEASVVKINSTTVRYVIVGSDAGGSYKCVIHVKAGLVVSRRVSDGEFPDNFFEETRYVSVPFKD